MSMQIALFFADGRSYFLGSILIMIASSLTRAQHKVLRGLCNMTLLGGIILVVASSTPAPPWFLALWSVTFIAWGILRSNQGASHLRLRLASQVALPAACFCAIGLEWPHRMLPEVKGVGIPRLVIIGDSISAGMGRSETMWPHVLAQQHAFLEVIDLSRAGETVDSARHQCSAIPPGPAIVLLEIGGNDLLGETTAADFETGLIRLLEETAGPNRSLVMFELPLPPLGHRYGWIQRNIAKQYGVSLIPKRVMSDVLGSPEGTLDGLHLSDKGHVRMADHVWQIIQTPH